MKAPKKNQESIYLPNEHEILRHLIQTGQNFHRGNNSHHIAFHKGVLQCSAILAILKGRLQFTQPGGQYEIVLMLFWLKINAT